MSLGASILAAPLGAGLRGLGWSAMARRALAVVPRVLREDAALDSDAAFVIGLVNALSHPPMHRQPARMMRSLYDALSIAAGPRCHRMREVRDFSWGQRRGRSMLARLYLPFGDPDAPLLVFWHGGGFMIGSVGGYDRVCRALALAGRFNVLALQYRLAPEHPFPAAVDDALDAYRWAIATNVYQRISPSAVAVGGDSAGAMLAAIVATDSSTLSFRPDAQLLIYPVVDLHGDYPSEVLFGENLLLTRKMMARFRSAYRSEDAASGHSWGNLLASKDLRKAPQTVIVQAGYDPLHDQAEAFHAALVKERQSVRILKYPALPHAFLNIAGLVPQAYEALQDISVALREALPPRT
ncbi:MAG: alpha/beta hydrolase [Novosphingobium sp.]|nr:alpha/beta hydrolase [Novosphingobium sp.]